MTENGWKIGFPSKYIYESDAVWNLKTQKEWDILTNHTLFH